jgi:hypothetical protein
MTAMKRREETWNGGETFELAADETMRLPRGRFVVRADRGTVLVTQEGDLEDHVLEAGDELVLARQGLAVAWAFTDAAVTVREARDLVLVSELLSA